MRLESPADGSEINFQFFQNLWIFVERSRPGYHSRVLHWNQSPDAAARQGTASRKTASSEKPHASISQNPSPVRHTVQHVPLSEAAVRIRCQPGNRNSKSPKRRQSFCTTVPRSSQSWRTDCTDLAPAGSAGLPDDSGAHSYRNRRFAERHESGLCLRAVSQPARHVSPRTAPSGRIPVRLHTRAGSDRTDNRINFHPSQASRKRLPVSGTPGAGRFTIRLPPHALVPTAELSESFLPSVGRTHRPAGLV